MNWQYLRIAISIVGNIEHSKKLYNLLVGLIRVGINVFWQLERNEIKYVQCWTNVRTTRCVNANLFDWKLWCIELYHEKTIFKFMRADNLLLVLYFFIWKILTYYRFEKNSFWMVWNCCDLIRFDSVMKIS